MNYYIRRLTIKKLIMNDKKPGGPKHEQQQPPVELPEFEVVFNKKKGTVTKNLPKFAPSKKLRPVEQSHDGPDNKQALEKLAKVAQNLGARGASNMPVKRVAKEIANPVKGQQRRAKDVLKSWNMFGDDTQEIENDSIFVTKLNKKLPFDSTGVKTMNAAPEGGGGKFVQQDEKLTYKNGKIQKR